MFLQVPIAMNQGTPDFLSSSERFDKDGLRRRLSSFDREFGHESKLESKPAETTGDDVSFVSFGTLDSSSPMHRRKKQNSAKARQQIKYCDEHDGDLEQIFRLVPPNKGRGKTITDALPSLSNSRNTRI